MLPSFSSLEASHGKKGCQILARIKSRRGTSPSITIVFVDEKPSRLHGARMASNIPPEEVGHESVATLSSPWQYDEQQPACKACHAEFSPLNRRHHCRLCGFIFCHNCSDQKALVPPSSIVLTPKGGKKAKARSAADDYASFSPDQDPDRMLTYLSNQGDHSQVLYGKGLEERFLLAREPLRVCRPCYQRLAPLQEDLRNANSHAMRFNHVDPTDARRLFNSPLAFTLGHEIRKAAYTLNNLLPLPKRMGAVMSTAHWNETPSELQACKESCSSVSPNLGDLDGMLVGVSDDSVSSRLSYFSRRPHSGSTHGTSPRCGCDDCHQDRVRSCWGRIWHGLGGRASGRQSMECSLGHWNGWVELGCLGGGASLGSCLSAHDG